MNDLYYAYEKLKLIQHKTNDQKNIITLLQMKLIRAHQFNLVQNFIWRKGRFKLFFKSDVEKGCGFELCCSNSSIFKTVWTKKNKLISIIYLYSKCCNKIQSCGEKITPTLTFSIRVLITESGLYNTSSWRIQSINPCMKVFSRHLLGPNDWTTSRTDPPNPPKLMIDLGKKLWLQFF